MEDMENNLNNNNKINNYHKKFAYKLEDAMDT